MVSRTSLTPDDRRVLSWVYFSQEVFVLFFFPQARQINVDNVSALYESDMFLKNRFLHDKKRKLIIQTL